MHLILVLLSSVATLPLLLAQMMAPYKHIELHSFSNCEDVKDTNMTYELELKTEKDGSGKIYGYFDSPLEIGRDMEVFIKLYRWNAASWSKIYSTTNKDLCAGLQNTVPEVVELLMERCGRKGFICPVEAGVYNIEGFPQRIPPLKSYKKLPSGKYKFSLLIKHQGSNYACVEVIASICSEDKKNISPGK